jgi:hypothetical protein
MSPFVSCEEIGGVGVGAGTNRDCDVAVWSVDRSTLTSNILYPVYLSVKMAGRTS